MKNVIILHTDQQRLDSLGCSGNRFARTPNLDALAASGTYFSRHITANPVCCPSRASLLTGRYIGGHGLWYNGVPLSRKCYENVLPKDEEGYRRLHDSDLFREAPTLADMLAGHGYDTAAFGKLHLTPHATPSSYGFEESASMWAEGKLTEDWTGPYYGFQHVKFALAHGEGPCEHGQGHYSIWLRREHPEVIEALEDAHRRKKGAVAGQGDIYLSPVPARLHNTTWLGDQACEYIDGHKDSDRPFFLFVGFPDPHRPFSPPEDFAQDFLDVDVPRAVLSEEELFTKPSAMRMLMTETRGRNIRGKSPEVRLTAARYTAAMVSLIDRAVGNIIDRLHANGQWDETIVIFTSDHGDCMGDHGLLYKDFFALRCLVNVPFILRAPGAHLPERIDGNMSNTDVAPTVLSLLNLPIPPGVQGINVLADGAMDDHTPMVTCYTGRPDQTNLSIYDSRYRYSLYTQLDEEELYDHENDPGELVNLAHDPTPEAREICRRLRSRLLEQHARCDVPVNHRVSGG